ncbi:MAG: polymer-forming cytoskeletal protein [bacterium]|nr:polymer-forming cytoskeletal protein [bacterium]
MKRSVATFFVMAIIAALVAATPCHAQVATSPQTTDSNPPRDTIFYEIELTSEGVDAVDTAGNHWTYDFEQNSFVPDKSVVVRTGRPGEGRVAVEALSRPHEDRCTQEKMVKPLQGTVLVGYDEFVANGFTAYGRVTVKGWVKGDIQSISGRVLVTESGRVDGDIKAPEIEVKDGAMVSGQQSITDPLDFPTEVLQRSFSVDGLVIVCGFLAFLLVIAFLITTLFPAQLGTFSTCLFEFKARAVFIGLLFLFLLPLILILVSITIIGIAVVPFIPLAYILAMATGVVALGGKIGAAISGRVLGGSQNRVVHALIGVPVFMLLWVLVAILLGSSGVAQGFGIFLLVISIIITLFPLLGGLGAAVLTRFGYREHKGIQVNYRSKASEAPAPAPPPIPDFPRLVTPPPPIPPVSPQDQPPDKFGPYGPTPRPPLTPPGS